MSTVQTGDQSLYYELLEGVQRFDPNLFLPHE